MHRVALPEYIRKRGVRIALSEMVSHTFCLHGGLTLGLFESTTA